MKKIPCLFERTFHGHNSFTLLQTVTPGCEWVLAGEGIPTRKRDGTACLIRDSRLYKRYDAKHGKTPPEYAIPCDPAPDPVTGHWPHWVLVRKDDPASKWHWEAWMAQYHWSSERNGFVDGRLTGVLADGTYELCGPHFSPAEGLPRDAFFRHGDEIFEAVDHAMFGRTFEGLRLFLSNHWAEGIVFHHPDGRMVKIRRDDYGFPWKPGRK